MPTILVTLPDELLEEIDRVVEAEHRTRGDVLREAARQFLARRGAGKRRERPEVRRAVELIAQLRAKRQDV